MKTQLEERVERERNGVGQCGVAGHLLEPELESGIGRPPEGVPSILRLPQIVTWQAHQVDQHRRRHEWCRASREHDDFGL
jgi:hypothetical protein